MPDHTSASEYHEQTKHSPESVRNGPRLNFNNKPLPYKNYTDLPAVSLPDKIPELDPPALDAIAVDTATPPSRLPVDGRPPNQIDREILTQLCHYATGITKEIQRENRTLEFRAAACTGALYHIDLYLVVGNVDGLDPGVYHFDPQTNSLERLRDGDYRGVLADATGHNHVVEAPLTVITTSTWWRNAWKYGNRTFRHAFWDSGTVLANLVATGHSRGLAVSVVLGFADDPIVDLLGLDPTAEAALELVAVGTDDPVAEPPTVDPLDPSTEPLSPDPKTHPLIYQAWRAGVLSNRDAAAEWRHTAHGSVPVGTRRGGGERVSLDPVDHETASSRPLGNTIVRRGSCRAYEREPISFRKLSTVTDRAVQGVPLDCRDPDGPPLQFTECYLIVHAVGGLASGVYQLHAAKAELEQLREGVFRQEAGHIALDQQLAADAAVCFYFLTDLELLTDRLGDRGYRLAQFEASMTAGRLYLGTYAHRTLGGTGLTFYDDAVTEFLSPRASGQTPMFLYTVGRPEY